jgi:hypothetical protein
LTRLLHGPPERKGDARGFGSRPGAGDQVIPP